MTVTERVADAVDESPGATVVTLAAVLDSLGANVLRILAAPAGLDVPAHEPVIFDPASEVDVEPGDIVLAVGCDAARSEARRVVEQAASFGAAAVVIKVDDSPPASLLDAAREAGVALLGVSRRAQWGQLHTLLRTVQSAVGAAQPSALGDVPLGDLFALANAIAGFVGGAVTIEDHRSTVLAYSSTGDPIDEARRDTILGRQVPTEWQARLREDGVFRALWSNDEVLHVDYAETFPFLRHRLVVAIRAGGEFLGSIWVAEGDQPFGTAAEAALRESRHIAALHLIRHRVGDDLERRRRGEQLRAVLEGRAAPDLLGRMLHLPVTARAALFAFRPVADGPADIAVHAERLSNLVSIQCEAYRQTAVVTVLDGSVYVLVPDVESADGLRLASDIVYRAGDSARTRVRAAVGSTVPLRELDTSRREADLVLRVLEARGLGTAHVDDLRSHVVLTQLRDATDLDPSFKEGKVAQLVAHDAERNTAYVETLRAYLDAFGDVRAAAAALAVHPNTFRYRLRRLAEVVDLDVDDPVERLVAHLQLYLLET